MTRCIPLPGPRPSWSAIVPSGDAESVSGDLLEAYRDEQLPARGRTGASRWYMRQVARAFARSAWMWIVPLVALFVFADVANVWRTPTASGVPFVGLALIAGAALRSGWRTRRVGGGLLAGAGTAATLWICMAVWWMGTWYPAAFIQQADPYWINAWHYGAAPGESFLHWIFWDNVGAIVMSGIALNAAGVVIGLTGGFLSVTTRRVVGRT